MNKKDRIISNNSKISRLSKSRQTIQLTMLRYDESIRYNPISFNL